MLLLDFASMQRELPYNGHESYQRTLLTGKVHVICCAAAIPEKGPV